MKKSELKSGGMYGLHNNLKFCLASMAHGNSIELKSGHVLAIADGQTEPGFLVNQYDYPNTEPSDQIVMQIGSPEVWMMLIKHVKQMTKEDSIKMALSYVDVRLSR